MFTIIPYDYIWFVVNVKCAKREELCQRNNKDGMQKAITAFQLDTQTTYMPRTHTHIYSVTVRLF